MLNILFSFVFKLINFVANSVLSFLMSGLSIFVGDRITATTQIVFSSVFNFFTAVSNYIIFAIDMLCIPRALFEFTFTILLALLTFVGIARTYVFTITLYRHFKP